MGQYLSSADSVVVPGHGLLVFSGANYTGSTSQQLTTSQDSWTPGPHMFGGYNNFYQCSVQVILLFLRV
jgi:hypothetical protein